MPRLPLVLIGLALAFAAGWGLRTETAEKASPVGIVSSSTARMFDNRVEIVPDPPRGQGAPIPGGLTRAHRPRLNVEQALRAMDGLDFAPDPGLDPIDSETLATLTESVSTHLAARLADQEAR